MDREYLRELAEEGAAIHNDPQPEREVCDGLIWALDEIERLREALGIIAAQSSGEVGSTKRSDCMAAIAAAALRA